MNTCVVIDTRKMKLKNGINNMYFVGYCRVTRCRPQKRNRGTVVEKKIEGTIEYE